MRQQLPGDHRGAEAQSRPDEQRQRQERERQHLLGPEHQQGDPGQQQRLQHQLGAVGYGRPARARPARAGRSPGWRPGATASPSGRRRGRRPPVAATDRPMPVPTVAAPSTHAATSRKKSSGDSSRGSPGRPAQVARWRRAPRRRSRPRTAATARRTPGREVGQAARDGDSGRERRPPRPGLSTMQRDRDAGGRPPGGDLAAGRREVDRGDPGDIDQRQHRARPRTARSRAGRHSCCAVCQPGAQTGRGNPGLGPRPMFMGSGSTIRSQRWAVAPARIGSDSPVATNRSARRRPAPPRFPGPRRAPAVDPRARAGRHHDVQDRYGEARVVGTPGRSTSRSPASIRPSPGSHRPARPAPRPRSRPPRRSAPAGASRPRRRPCHAAASSRRPPGRRPASAAGSPARSATRRAAGSGPGARRQLTVDHSSGDSRMQPVASRSKPTAR